MCAGIAGVTKVWMRLGGGCSSEAVKLLCFELTTAFMSLKRSGMGGYSRNLSFSGSDTLILVSGAKIVFSAWPKP